MTDLSSLDVGNLSLEEIEQILPQLYQNLEEVKEAESLGSVTEEVDERPLNEIVDDKFSQLWDSVEKVYTDQYDADSKKEKASFILENGLRIVLESAIGKDHTKSLLYVAKKCVKDKNFKVSQKFFRMVDDPEVTNVAKLSFAVYRANLPDHLNDSFIKRKRAKEYISRLVRIDSPLMKAVAADFAKVGLLPS